MITIGTDIADTYYLIYSDDMAVFTFGFLPGASALSTGQPNVFTYESIDGLREAVDNIKGIGYFDQFIKLRPIHPDVDLIEDIP